METLNQTFVWDTHSSKVFSEPFHKPNFRCPSHSPMQIVENSLNTEFPRLLSESKWNIKLKEVLYTDASKATEIELCDHLSDGKLYVVKKIIKSQMRESDLESAKHGMITHNQLWHPNILESYDLIETNQELVQLLEYLPKADYLTEKLETMNEPFNTKPDGGVSKLKSMCFDLLQGLAFLHSQNLVHLDIKPGNVLLDKKVPPNEFPRLKICDFGLSRKSGSFTKGACGSDGYMAPEVKSGKQVTGVADMWSFGMLIHKLVVGYLPWVLKWRPGEPLPCHSRHWKKYQGTGLFELIEACLTLDPFERITAEQALKSQFLS